MELQWDVRSYMDIGSKVSALKNHELFRSMSDKDLTSLAAKCEITTLDRRQTIIRQGDPSKGFFFVISGMIKLYRSRADTLQTIVRFVPAGCTFGEATIFHDEAYPVCASACVPSQVLHVPTAEVVEKMKTSWDFCSEVLKLMCLRLKEQMKKVEYLTMPSVLLRYAFFLDQERVNTGGVGKDLITLTMTGREIATHLGTTPESVSRLFNDFMERGIMARQKDRDYALDRSKLYKLIEEELANH